MRIKKQKFTSVFERVCKNKQIHEAVLLIENSQGDFSYANSYGEKDIDTPLLMASITKLFITTCMLILKEQGKLSLDDKLTKYLNEKTLHKLHVYKGKDYSQQLTLAHLLFQTSGLPDVYEEGKDHAVKSAIHEDYLICFDEIIKITKQLKPHFAPHMTKNAHYSSVNFDLLGKILENVTQSTLEDVFQQFICDPLELKNTYLPQHDDFIPNIFFKDKSLHRPQFIRSCRASGGGISTARELMVFTKAFFAGKLFDKAVFQKLDKIYKLQFSMFPIHYGAGFMNVPLNGLATLFMGKGELIGHSGSTGSFAFYFPRKDMFFVGDVNQAANPALPVRLAMQLAMSMKN